LLNLFAQNYLTYFKGGSFCGQKLLRALKCANFLTKTFAISNLETNSLEKKEKTLAFSKYFFFF